MPGRMCPRPRAVAPWVSKDHEDPLKEAPRESAQECVQQPPSTRSTEDPYKRARERVLGEVNSSPQAFGSPRTKKVHSRERVLGEANGDPLAFGTPTTQGAPWQWPPRGPPRRCQPVKGPRPHFKSVRGLSHPTAPAVLSVSSCHVLAERRGVINCTGPVPCLPACLRITL